MGKFNKSVKVVSALAVNGRVCRTPEAAAQIIFRKMVARQHARQIRRVGSIWTDMPWRLQLSGLHERAYRRVLKIATKYYS